MVFLAAAVLVRTVAAQSPDSHQHSFGDAEKWAHVFDDPERDAWQKPHEVVRALALKPDATVADIGAGTGYFAARLAKMLPKGTVYAVDLEPDMVKYLGERAKREGVKNLRPVAASADDVRLPAKVDLILDSPEGPPKEARIAPERVKTELAKAGYALEAEHAFLPRQYFLVFSPR
jgi:predicted methyltransferase